MTEIAPRPPRPPVRPGNYQLSKETWAEIVEAYRNGATARELAVKWKVAPGSVYYHACREGWTKKINGDDRAREHARTVEAATAAGEPGRAEKRALKALFAAPRLGNPYDIEDPADLARLAARASGRAMRSRLWSEAKALTALAESYQRMAGQEMARSAGTTETLPLRSVWDVRLAGEERLYARFHINDRPGVKDPDRDLKESFWQWERFQKQLKEAMELTHQDTEAHANRLEALLRQNGIEPPAKPKRVTQMGM